MNLRVTVATQRVGQAYEVQTMFACSRVSEIDMAFRCKDGGEFGQ